MEPQPNIAGWSKRKLVQFIEDNFDFNPKVESPAGSISFLFHEAGTLGWLNESGRTVVFSNEGTAGSGVVDGYSVDGETQEGLPVSIADGQLFEVAAIDVDESFYVSYRVE